MSPSNFWYLWVFHVETSSANRRVLLFQFDSFCLLFPPLIAVAKTSRPCWQLRSGHPVFVPDFRKCFTLHHWSFAVGHDSFTVQVCPYSCWCSCHKMDFRVAPLRHHMVLPSILLMWWITLIGRRITEESYLHPWDKPTWSLRMILCLLILIIRICWGFLHPCSMRRFCHLSGFY